MLPAGLTQVLFAMACGWADTQLTSPAKLRKSRLYRNPGHFRISDTSNSEQITFARPQNLVCDDTMVFPNGYSQICYRLLCMRNLDNVELTVIFERRYV